MPRTSISSIRKTEPKVRTHPLDNSFIILNPILERSLGVRKIRIINPIFFGSGLSPFCSKVLISVIPLDCNCFMPASSFPYIAHDTARLQK